MFVTAGMSVDAGALRETLDRLRANLARPSISVGGSGALGHDRERVTLSLKALLTEIDRTDLNAVQALSGLVREFRPESQVEALRSLFASLQEGWRQFITRSLGEEKLRTLWRLLASPAPDVLRILGREEEENAHSELIAWLLSPQRAPTVARHALVALMTKLPDHRRRWRVGGGAESEDREALDLGERWKERIEAAADAGLISVRREVLIGRELAGSDDLCRIDIMVSGPGFVLAIENKVWAHEHWDQTKLYWSWLEPMRCLRAGLFLSPSGLIASCDQFAAASYIELLSALLDGPTKAPLTGAEEIVLSSYLKTLQRYILPVEIKAAIEAVHTMEGQ